MGLVPSELPDNALEPAGLALAVGMEALAGIALGLAMAALGGCMVPFEIFPDGLRTVAHITPHAWAIDAFTEVIQRGGGLGQIGLELTVLVLYGGALLAAASYTLRRAIIG